MMFNVKCTKRQIINDIKKYNHIVTWRSVYATKSKEWLFKNIVSVLDDKIVRKYQFAIPKKGHLETILKALGLSTRGNKQVLADRIWRFREHKLAKYEGWKATVKIPEKGRFKKIANEDFEWKIVDNLV